MRLEAEDRKMNSDSIRTDESWTKRVKHKTVSKWFELDEIKAISLHNQSKNT